MKNSRRIVLPLSLSVLAMAAMCPMTVYATEGVTEEQTETETPESNVINVEAMVGESFDLKEHGATETTELTFETDAFNIDVENLTATPLKAGTFTINMKNSEENIVILNVNVKENPEAPSIIEVSLDTTLNSEVSLSPYEVQGEATFEDLDSAFEINAEAKTAKAVLGGTHILTITGEDGNGYKLTVNVAETAMAPAISLITINAKVNDVIDLKQYNAVEGTKFTDADNAFEINEAELTAKVLTEGEHDLVMQTSESEIITLKVIAEKAGPDVQKVHKDLKLNDVIDLSEFGVDENTSYGFPEDAFELNKEAKTLKVLKEGTFTVMIKLSEDKAVELEVSVPVTQTETTSEATTQETTKTTDDGKGNTTETGDEIKANKGIFVLAAAVVAGVGGVLALKKKKN